MLWTRILFVCGKRQHERSRAVFRVTQAGGLCVYNVYFLNILICMDYEILQRVLEGFMTMKLKHIPLLKIDLFKVYL